MNELPPASSGQFSAEHRLTLRGSVTPKTLDDAIDTFYRRKAAAVPILVDFRKADFAEISMLCNCIAFVAARLAAGHATYLALPDRQDVRDFLTVWRFGDALSAATGLLFERLVVSDHHNRLQENQETYRGYGNALRKLEFNPDWRPEHGGLRNFFEFVTYAKKGTDRIKPVGDMINIPRQEGMRWARPLIQSVLERHLTGGSVSEEIARVIIYESISNAVRHPEASVIQATSKFEQSINSQGKQSNHLRICVWDDGEGIIQTLRAALNEGRPVRALNLPAYMYDSYSVEVRNYDRTHSKIHPMGQKEEFDTKTSDAKLLLGSLFPGVSRNVDGKVPTTAPFHDKPEAVREAIAATPGMGLYALQRTVLDLLGGSIVIRSGSYRLWLALSYDRLRKETGARYWGKITQYPSDVPPFRGNLLVVQIPLKPIDPAEAAPHV